MYQVGLSLHCLVGGGPFNILENPAESVFSTSILQMKKLSHKPQLGFRKLPGGGGGSPVLLTCYCMDTTWHPLCHSCTYNRLVGEMAPLIKRLLYKV